MILINKINESYAQVDGLPFDYAQTLSDEFSFTIPGYQHMPAFKKSKGKWDGKIRLFNSNSGIIPFGLVGDVAVKLSKYKLPYTFGDSFVSDDDYPTLTEELIDELLNEAGLPGHFDKRDYQYAAAITAINAKRCIVESATGSGKSFLAYILLLYYLKYTEGNIALIVPRTSLVEQMYSDFEEYGMDVEEHCDRLYAKYSNAYTNKRILITTWQTISKLPEGYTARFQSIIGDEAHTFKATELKKLMDAAINAEFRTGMTGSLPDKPNDLMTIRALFGPIFTAAKSADLIKRKYLNDMEPIHVMVMKYTPEECQEMIGAKYQDEISFIIANERRMKFCVDLVKQLKGNTLVMFARIDTHGKPLFARIKNETKKPTYYVAGSVKTQDREAIRKQFKNETDGVIVASVGTFSTGINIPNLDNLVICAPTKSGTTLTQMIGRVLRKSNRKTRVFDLVDDLSIGDNKNYALQHGLARLKVYAMRDYQYELETITL